MVSNTAPHALAVRTYTLRACYVLLLQEWYNTTTLYRTATFHEMEYLRTVALFLTATNTLLHTT